MSYKDSHVQPADFSIDDLRGAVGELLAGGGVDLSALQEQVADLEIIYLILLNGTAQMQAQINRLGGTESITFDPNTALQYTQGSGAFNKDDNSADNGAHIMAADSIARVSAYLREGTWSFRALTVDLESTGILTVDIEEGVGGTIDTYQSGFNYNQLNVINDLVIGTDGIYAIELSNLTKNASSSQKRVFISSFSLVRTGDVPG